MVRIVTHSDRIASRELVAAMHRDRKRVFVDRLGWDVPVVDGQFEIDQFDTRDAVYLIVPDATGRGHAGSLRLLPTIRPHLMSDLFPHLCEDGPPIADDVWEISRLCVSPDLPDNRPPRTELMLALAEYALLWGIRRYTLVSHMAYLSVLLSIGWDCEPLGLPVKDKDATIGALAINITPATLSFLREQTGIRASVLSLPVQAAA